MSLKCELLITINKFCEKKERWYSLFSPFKISLREVGRKRRRSKETYRKVQKLTSIFVLDLRKNVRDISKNSRLLPTRDLKLKIHQFAMKMPRMNCSASWLLILRFFHRKKALRRHRNKLFWQVSLQVLLKRTFRRSNIFQSTKYLQNPWI